jgi:hypothetical protein
MQILVFDKEDLRPVAVYEAEAIDEDRIVSSKELVHIELPEGISPSDCVITETSPGIYSVA